MTVKNSDRFIVAYNRIEKILAEKADSNDYSPFYRLIDKVKITNSVVRKYEDDLREFGDLRNAIVHSRTDVDYVIAEPHDEIVEHIELIEEKQELLRSRQQAPGKVTLGIRPEHIHVLHQDSPVSIRAQVDVCEMMGSEMHLHASVNEMDVVIRVSTDEMGSVHMRPGKNSFIQFEIPGRLIHLFDIETEENLLI